VASQKLTVGGVSKYLDDGGEQTLATIHGIGIRQTGPFIYATGNGDATGDPQTPVPGASEVNIAKFCPPYANASGTVYQVYGGGIVDAWTANVASTLITVAPDNAKITGAGKIRTRDVSSYTNARPFMVGFYGDSATSRNVFSLTVNGVKKDVIPSPEDHAGSLYRYVKRQNITITADVTDGRIDCSSLGSVVIMNIVYIDPALPAGDTVLAGLPVEFRPPVDISFPLVWPAFGTSHYFRAKVLKDGRVIVSRTNVVTSGRFRNLFGIGIWSTSLVNNPPLFVKEKLTIKGVTKEITRLNNPNLTTQYTSTKAIVFNTDADSGTLHLWRFGNFVFGNTLDFNPRTSLANNSPIFLIPDGFRPAYPAYSCSYGYKLATGEQGTEKTRLKHAIGPDGTVAGQENAGGTTEKCGFSCYYYCNQ
jgi:hypothetical protein